MAEKTPEPASNALLAPFPSAVGVSHLRVYDSEAPDGIPRFSMTHS